MGIVSILRIVNLVLVIFLMIGWIVGRKEVLVKLVLLMKEVLVIVIFVFVFNNVFVCFDFIVILILFCLRVVVKLIEGGYLNCEEFDFIVCLFLDIILRIGVNF